HVPRVVCVVRPSLWRPNGLSQPSAPGTEGSPELADNGPWAPPHAEQPKLRGASGARMAAQHSAFLLLACRKTTQYTLNHMAQYLEARLDASFAALSDATRRGVLEKLCRADASITELADKFDMTLTGMKKHVDVLERAGLVTTEKVGRVRTCRLGMRALEEETAWIERHRQLWNARFDELEKIVEELKAKEKADARRKRS
ncbi:MAG: metalloregulator ArsR/SmtB family transcription factor, partial [Hyphomonadaceae bacterium]